MSHIKLILAAIAFLYAPHLVVMILWEFITWGNAVWYISEWSNLARAWWVGLYFIYFAAILAAVTGIL